MPDTFETYGIVYKAETDEARAKILSLKDPLTQSVQWGATAVASVSQIGDASTVAAGKVSALTGSLMALKQIAEGRFAVSAIFDDLTASIDFATRSAKGLNSEVSLINGRARDVGRVTSAVEGLGQRSDQAKVNMANLGAAISGLGGKAATVGEIRDGVMGIQRQAYGAHMNLDRVGVSLSALGGKASGIGVVSAQLGTLRKGFAGSAGGARRVGTALDSWIARIATIRGVQQAVEDLGKGLTEARQKADKGGRANLNVRDSYRELANLLGKSEPDNEVVAGAMRVRIATGLSDRETNDALRRFQGGLPNALARGNITGDATTGVAGDFIKEAMRTGLRVDVKGGTSALLAAKLAQQQFIPDAATGAGEIQTILDTLNRGDGDLDPLVGSLIKGSGGYVGPGMAFPNLKEFAAAQSTASLNASPTVSSTRVAQAFAGMQDVMKDPSKNKDIGLTPGDFVGNINKLAPLLEGAENQDQVLHDLGIGNRASRRSLRQFVANRDVLMRETEAVRAGVPALQVKGLNDKFFAGNDAQKRIAAAQKDAAAFVQWQGQEPVVIARDKAEASLKGRLDLDTPAAQQEEAGADNFITRGAALVVRKMVGQEVPADQLPIVMGGKPTRQIKIDREAESQARDQARTVKLDPDSIVHRAFGDAQTTPEERIEALTKATQSAKGQPFKGSGETDALLRQLVAEQVRTRETIEKAQKPGPLPLLPNPGHLLPAPLNKPTFRIDPF